MGHAQSSAETFDSNLGAHGLCMYAGINTYIFDELISSSLSSSSFLSTLASHPQQNLPVLISKISKNFLGKAQFAFFDFGAEKLILKYILGHLRVGEFCKFYKKNCYGWCYYRVMAQLRLEAVILAWGRSSLHTTKNADWGKAFCDTFWCAIVACCLFTALGVGIHQGILLPWVGYCP